MPVIRTRYGTRFEFDQHGCGRIILADGSIASPFLWIRENVDFCIEQLLKVGRITESEAADIYKDAELAKMRRLNDLWLHAVDHAYGKAKVVLEPDEVNPFWQ